MELKKILCGIFSEAYDMDTLLCFIGKFQTKYKTQGININSTFSENVILVKYSKIANVISLKSYATDSCFLYFIINYFAFRLYGLNRHCCGNKIFFRNLRKHFFLIHFIVRNFRKKW